jgi:hypothetical protein
MDFLLVHSRTGFIYKPFFDRFMEDDQLKLWEKGTYRGQMRIFGGPFSGKVSP